MGDAGYSFVIDTRLIFQLPKNSVLTIQFILITISLKSSNNRNVGNGVSSGSDHWSHLLMSRLTDEGARSQREGISRDCATKQLTQN